MTELELSPCDVVVVRAFEDVPEQLCRDQEVFEDCVAGFAVIGPLARNNLQNRWIRGSTTLTMFSDLCSN